ncbi:MAG: ParB/Srx family N-terminal domain-containing protein [Cetobacterium sp.]
MNLKLKIEKVGIDSIKNYKKNSKMHPEWHIEQIKKSILEFGFNDPIAVDSNLVVIAGHGRLEALKRLNYKEVEVIKIDHLTEIQKKAYIIAHNKINANTGFDLEILKEEIEDLKNENYELDNTFFSEGEIDLIFTENIFSDDSFLDDVEAPEDEKEKLCPHCGGKL